ncbi:hypothetical protein EDD11_006306 [Mortierella claussenii]|nr:hypothetical protein EDD11_006306 [Mortierella claussenii]
MVIQKRTHFSDIAVSKITPTSFSVGDEMAHRPYAFVKSFSGLIGEMRTERSEDVLTPDEYPRHTLEMPSVGGTQLHLHCLGAPL